VDLSGLAAGNSVTFTLRETAGGDWLISDIQPAGAMSAHDMHDMDDIPEMEETDHSGHADPHGGHRP
jgi:hypothetical protein